MANIGYMRVSTKQQSTERQLDGLELDLIFEDKLSGRSRKRPELVTMMAQLRAGDEVYVHEVSRLARSVVDLEQLVREIVEKGAAVTFIKENLRFDDSDDPMKTMMLQMLGSFAQFSRAIICENVREGVAIAKAAGKMKGSKPTIDRKIVAQLVAGGASNAVIAEALKVSARSIQRIKIELGLSDSKATSKKAS